MRRAFRLAGAPVPPGLPAHALLWLVLAFVLNLLWEIAQARLYAIWTEAAPLGVAWALLHCSIGDAMIALTMFALAGIALRRADWPVSRPWSGGAIVVMGSMAYTVWSEWHNVYRAGNWAYAASMPLIFGIGLSPLLQWLLLPPLLVAAHRALGPALFGWRNPRATPSAFAPAKSRKEKPA